MKRTLGKSYKFQIATNHIIFFDEEISPEGIRHIQALHITIKSKDMIVALVLIEQDWR